MTRCMAKLNADLACQQRFSYPGMTNYETYHPISTILLEDIINWVFYWVFLYTLHIVLATLLLQWKIYIVCMILSWIPHLPRCEGIIVGSLRSIEAPCVNLSCYRQVQLIPYSEDKSKNSYHFTLLSGRIYLSSGQTQGVQMSEQVGSTLASCFSLKWLTQIFDP